MKKRWRPTRLADGERPPIEIVEPSRPTRWRSIGALFHLFRLVAGLLLFSRRGTPGRTAWARRLRLHFERMGVLWIKTGQLLSLRSDIFSNEFCLELSRLQDRAKGFPPAVARSIVEAELGRPIEEVFDVFVDAPIAAASIAQIHKARLARRGRWVVVKVQKPDARWTLEMDIRVMRRLARLFDAVRFYANVRWREFLWEIEQILDEEVDYRYEASFLRRMGLTLAEHRKIVVPRVHDAYTTERILVMDHIDGVLMSDVIHAARTDPDRLARWYRANRIDPVEVARRLVGTLHRQVFEDNLFHGDMHPGNILLLTGGRIALIDFGTVGRIESEALALNRMYLEAIGEGEYSKAVDVLFLLTPNLPHHGLGAIKEEIIRILRSWETRVHMKGLTYGETSVATVTKQINSVLVRNRLEANWTMLKLGRSWETLDASLAYLDPDLDYPELVQAYRDEARRRALERQRSRGYPDLVGGAHTLLAGARTGAEQAFFQVMILRRQAKVFGSSTGTAAYFLSLVFGALSLACLAACLAAVWVLARQHHALATAPGWIDRAPQLPYAAWLAIACALLYVAWRQERIRRRFAEAREEDGANPYSAA